MEIKKNRFDLMVSQSTSPKQRIHFNDFDSKGRNESFIKP